MIILLKFPPDIYKRILFKSNSLMLVSPEDDTASVIWFYVGTKESLSDGKYYFYTPKDITYIGRYLIGYYILKDI